MNPKIQEVSRQYFENRTEKNFNEMYKHVRPIIEGASRSILKDATAVEDNVSNTFLKIVSKKWVTVFETAEGQKNLTIELGPQSTENDVVEELKKVDGFKKVVSINYNEWKFDEDKSFLSWLFNTAKNGAIMMYNKTRRKITKETENGTEVVRVKRVILESECINEDNEEIENTLDHLYYNSGVDKEYEQLDKEESTKYYMKIDKPYERVIGIIDEISDNAKDAELLKERLIDDISPEVLKEKYGISSRITVTSRRRRGLQKIHKILLPEINAIKMQDGVKCDGEVTIPFSCGKKIQHRFNVEGGILNGHAICYYNTGKIKSKSHYVNGVKDGLHQEFYANGFIKIEGNFLNGEKVGVWSRYSMDGLKEESVDHSNFGYYNIFDENERKIDEGFSRVPANSDLIKAFHTNGIVSKVGLMVDGKKVGIWRRYYENGKLEEVVNHNTGAYILYDEKGKVEDEGNLR